MEMMVMSLRFTSCYLATLVVWVLERERERERPEAAEGTYWERLEARGGL